MMTKSNPKQIIALLASTFLTATAAHAQADPSRYVLDANGVDVTRGTFTYSKTDISIGTGDAALSLVRPYIGLFGRSQYELHLYQNGSLWSAEIGTTSLIFSQSGSTFTTTLGDGATMTQSGSGVTATYTVILASGVQYTYGYSRTSTGDVSTLRSRISQIKRPTGETLTIRAQPGIKSCVLGGLSSTVG